MTETTSLPSAYRTIDPEKRARICPALPRNIFIEVTNRCNLRCETCPRTYTTYEPARDLSLEEFVAIAEQFPEMERAVLHGIGEPLLNPQLADMIRYLKGRGVHVLFNSNGTLLDAAHQVSLAQSGLDEYRLSLDAAEPELYARIRGRRFFDRVVANLRGFMTTLQRIESPTPRVSIWCMAMKENIDQIPRLIELAADVGVPEVYLQRLTYMVSPTDRFGLGQKEQALYGHLQAREAEIIQACEALSRELGISFRASGATSPQHSLDGAASRGSHPWSACLRPWTTAYITANGNALPCCIAPFASARYEELILGNVWDKPFADHWNAPLYRRWREGILGPEPHAACSGCGVLWSL